MRFIFTIIKKIEKRYALSFITGLIFGCIAIYTTFFYTRKPNLRFEILSSTNLIDLHENISDLEIRYKNKDILKEKKSIHIYTIRINNIGTIDINKSFYDSRDPIGIDIINGKIVNTVEIINASTDYLKNKIKPNIINNQSITFVDPLFNSGDYLVIKFLVLHEKNKKPELYSRGILSGVSKISIVNIFEEAESKSIWKQIWEGNIGIYILRFFSYMIAFVLIVACIVLPITLIAEYINKRKRKKLVNKFKSQYKDILSKELLILIDEYQSDDDNIYVIEELLKNKTKLEKILKQKNNQLKLEHLKKQINQRDVTSISQRSMHFEKEYREIKNSQFLLRKNIIQKEGNKIVIPNDIMNSFKVFLKFVKDSKSK